MRSRNHMVARNTIVCFAIVSTTPGNIYKFKGNYKTREEFFTKITDYFETNLPEESVDLKVHKLVRTSSILELSDLSLIEI